MFYMSLSLIIYFYSVLSPFISDFYCYLTSINVSSASLLLPSLAGTNLLHLLVTFDELHYHFLLESQHLLSFWVIKLSLVLSYLLFQSPFPSFFDFNMEMLQDPFLTFLFVLSWLFPLMNPCGVMSLNPAFIAMTLKLTFLVQNPLKVHTHFQIIYLLSENDLHKRHLIFHEKKASHCLSNT